MTTLAILESFDNSDHNDKDNAKDLRHLRC